jgi:hypothetical protein
MHDEPRGEDSGTNNTVADLLFKRPLLLETLALMLDAFLFQSLEREIMSAHARRRKIRRRRQAMHGYRRHMLEKGPNFETQNWSEATVGN